MNKAELIDAAADKTDLSKSDVSAALDALLETITETVGKGETVKIPGLGNFDRRDNAARTGRNPQTGEKMLIAASKTPRFKAAKHFKDSVNN